MNITKALILLIMSLSMPIYAYAAAPQKGKPPSEVGKAIIKAGDLIDAGDYKKTIEYLTPIITKHPQFIRLHMLRGRAYFHILPAQLDAAEDDFNYVVSLDPKHEEATKLVAKIRGARSAQVSENVLNLIALAWEGALDIIVIALGVLMGMGSNNAFKDFFWRRKLTALYSAKHFDEYTDFLEKKLHEVNYAPVREAIRKSLELSNKKDVVTIIREHVDKPEHQEIMLKMLEKLVLKNT